MLQARYPGRPGTIMSTLAKWLLRRPEDCRTLFQQLGVQSVQVPPIGPVRQKVQVAVRTELNLLNSARDGLMQLVQSCQLRFFIQRSEPKVGLVPRHIGVVPAHECQQSSIRRQAWIDYEVTLSE